MYSCTFDRMESSSLIYVTCEVDGDVRKTHKQQRIRKIGISSMNRVQTVTENSLETNFTVTYLVHLAINKQAHWLIL